MIKDSIKQLRRARGLYQADLADALNVSQSTVASWENGTRRPDIDMLIRLADFFGVSSDELLERDIDAAKDVDEARQDLFSDPSRKALLNMARYGTPEAVRQVAAVIDALKATNPDYYSGDEPS